jgi:TPP-dependent pyruvate/acetoin dehydrogenase alpha subunit
MPTLSAYLQRHEHPPVSSSAPPREVLLEICEKLSLLKQNDERMRAAIKTGRFNMPYYPVRGQEAIPAAISVLLRPTDFICTIYRGTHDSLAKGCPVDLLWAELAGRKTGTCKGKGGPMHITHPDSGVMVTTGIVGSSMPIANGLAWGSKLKGTDSVTVAYFGDGAANIGAFHESLNLPVVFVCSNNGYAEHTRTEDCTSVDQIAKRAASYSMPGVRVDGNDPLKVYAAAREAVERARRGDGPTLLEAMTYRFNGHVFGDADAYMDPAEKAAKMKDDPYPRYRTWLLENAHASEAELKAVEDRHDAEIKRAMQFALDSAFPDEGELRRDVYATEVLE